MKQVYRFDKRPYRPQLSVPALNAVPDDYITGEMKKGLAQTVEPTAADLKLIQEQTANVWELLRDEMVDYPYPVYGLFLFDHTQCSGEYGNIDGICSFQRNLSTGGKRSIIGINTHAVHEGADFLAFVLLHEVSHAAIGEDGHSVRFHQYLNGLIARFNQRYGATLENDYRGD